MSDEPDSEEWWFEVRPNGARRKQPRPIEEVCSVSSGTGNTSDATSAKRYETFAHVALFVTVVLSVWGARPRKSAGSIEEVETLGCRPDGRREIQRCPRSDRRSQDLYCFARYSKDARDARGKLVGRKHERVRKQMTGQCQAAGQHLVEAVAGDQSIDRHFDTDIDVGVTSQPFFLGGRLAQTHLQAEHRKRLANELGRAIRPTVSAEK